MISFHLAYLYELFGEPSSTNDYYMYISICEGEGEGEGVRVRVKETFRKRF